MPANSQLKISIIDNTFNQLGFNALDIEQLDLIFHMTDALRELEALTLDTQLSSCEQVSLYWSAKGLSPEAIAVLQRNRTNLVYEDQRNILAKFVVAPHKTEPKWNPSANHGRYGYDDYCGCETITIKHAGLSAGMPCPKCGSTIQALDYVLPHLKITLSLIVIDSN